MTVATRIDRRFAAAQRARRKLLIPFITAGFPTLTDTVPLMHELVAAGADLIELGVPFSDPMADGPTIQRANERALANGVTLAKTLAMVEAFRANDADTPVVLMGYANPFEAMGWPRFAAAAQRVGVDGVLTVDLPPEEAEMPVAHLTAAALAPIFLLAPTSSPQRVAAAERLGDGFLYYVSLTGVTGAGHLDVADVGNRLTRLRQVVRLPVVVGFGVKDPASAQAIAALADGVVVGSRLIEEIEANPAALHRCVPALVAELRQAIDSLASKETQR
jgi:tryptophan synthase alpha chain